MNKKVNEEEQAFRILKLLNSGSHVNIIFLLI